MSDVVPSHARVVVIGGGIAGCSVAYHLTKLGWRDVVLLERRELSCGTTWHAAGLVGPAPRHPQPHAARQVRRRPLRALEAETGQATGFRRPGSVSLARNAGAHARAEAPGVDGALLRRRRRGDHAGRGRTPLAAHAHRRPGRRAVAAARRAHESHRHHARAREGRAPGRRDDPREHRGHRRSARAAAPSPASAPTRGDIACEVVVNCAGMWARELGAMAGVTVPLHASEHFYIVTEPMAGVTPDLPVLRDPDGYIYVREEVGGLLMGGFEPVAKPWGMDGIPADFAFSLLPEDWDHFQVLMEQAIDPHPRDRDGAGAPSRQRARRASRPTAATSSARRPSAATSSSRPASTRSASPRGRARARRWRSGSWAASRRWTCGTSTSAAWRRSRPIPRYLRERTVEMVGAALRHALALPAAGDGARRAARARCTTGSPRAARASAW